MKVIVAIKFNGMIKYQGNKLNSFKHKINYSREVKFEKSGGPWNLQGTSVDVNLRRFSNPRLNWWDCWSSAQILKFHPKYNLWEGRISKMFSIWRWKYSRFFSFIKNIDCSAKIKKLRFLGWHIDRKNILQQFLGGLQNENIHSKIVTQADV